MEGEEIMMLWTAPNERRCIKCGHYPCPNCENWCDVIRYEDGEVELCCDGECTYERSAIASNLTDDKNLLRGR